MFQDVAASRWGRLELLGTLYCTAAAHHCTAAAQAVLCIRLSVAASVCAACRGWCAVVSNNNVLAVMLVCGSGTTERLHMQAAAVLGVLHTCSCTSYALWCTQCMCSNQQIRPFYCAVQGGAFNQLAALSSQIQSFMAGAGNPAAAAAMAAAAMAAAAAAAGNAGAGASYEVQANGRGAFLDDVGQNGDAFDAGDTQQRPNATTAMQAVQAAMAAAAAAAAAATGGRPLLQPKAEQSCVASHAEPAGPSDDCKAAMDCAAGPAGQSAEQACIKADSTAAAGTLAAHASTFDADLAAAAAAAAEASAAAEAAAAAAAEGESRADLASAIPLAPRVPDALPVAAMETA